MTAPRAQAEPKPRSLTEVLSRRGVVTPQDASRLARLMARDWRPPLQYLREQKGLNEQDLLPAVAEYLGMECVESLAEVTAPEEFFDRVPPEYARAEGFVATALADGRLEVAVAAGPDIAHLAAELARTFNCPVHCTLAPLAQVQDAVDRSVRQRPQYLQDAARELDGGELAEDMARLERVTDVGELMRKTPVVKLVSLLIAQAVRTGSTDIHIQPMPDHLRVRFRTDGVLHDILRLPRSSQDAIISRVKVLGNMDIAERRAPQDGRASFRYADREIDVRISVVPTNEGERAVMRLLDKQERLLTLDELGLNEEGVRRLDQLIRYPHGMILVTGPTGSGKTTTLYAALTRLNSAELNIVTIEDPIEYRLPGVSQIQVLAQKDVTFGSMLRSIVRQDPDVIMLGEVRDAEAAEAAVQSALTGHMMFSTLHTNDAAGAFPRLTNLGVEPFLISSAVLAVMAQRLVRRVCPHCTEPDEVPPAELARLGVSAQQARQAAFRRGAGCDRCLGTGYSGRIGIFELLTMDDDIGALVNARSSSSRIRDEALKKGMRPLRLDGAQKAIEGITTVEEVLRVTQRSPV